MSALQLGGMEPDVGDRQVSLLCGCCDVTKLTGPASRALKVFICSTGTDMCCEQDALMAGHYAALNEYCRQKYGVEFHVLDLRWSMKSRLVPDEDVEREICMHAINECRSSSVALYFVGLIGQRYGVRPLPINIPAADFESIRSALMKNRNRESRGSVPLLDVCYELDENCPEPGVYRLVSQHNVSPLITHSPRINPTDRFLKEESEYDWIETQKEVKRVLLLGVEQAGKLGMLTPTDVVRYTASDVEKQIRFAIESTIRPSDCDLRAFLIRRTIVDLKNYADLPLVADSFAEVSPSPDPPGRPQLDPASRAALESLVDRQVPEWLPPGSVISRSVLWRHDAGVSAGTHRDYLDDVCAVFDEVVRSAVDQAASKMKPVWNAESTVEGELMTEIEQQLLTARRNAEGFQGREDLLELIRSYVVSTDLKPLIVYGPSGVGKTSLIAQAALQAPQWINNGTLVNVVRFAMTTSWSRDIRLLLASMCAQLSSIVPQVCWPTVRSLMSAGYSELRQCLACLLDSFPEDRNLVVFVDGVELLDDRSDSRPFDWVPRSVKENVKVVVTVERTDMLATVKKQVVKASNNFVEVTPMDRDECGSLLVSTLLNRYSRRLTDCQLLLLLDRVFPDGGLPMLVRLVASFVRFWISSDEVDDWVRCVPLNLDEAVDCVLCGLEQCYGHGLVSRVLGLLTVSDRGLSDAEMDDVLSLDDVAFEILQSQSSTVPPIRRMPPMTWYRVKWELSRDGWLTTRQCEGVALNQWTHEKLAARTCRRYLCDRATFRDLHSLLADYWLGTWSQQAKPATTGGRYGSAIRPTSGSCHDTVAFERFVPTQPLFFDAEIEPCRPRYNQRKLRQLPIHLKHAGRVDELNETVLFNYHWILFKSRACSMEDVLDGYSLSATPDSQLVATALRQSKPFIGANARNMAAELSGRLLPFVGVYASVKKLVLQCDRCGLENCALVPVFQYPESPGGPLKQSTELSGLPDNYSITLVNKALTNSSSSSSSNGSSSGDNNNNSSSNGQLLLAKETRSPNIQVVDINTGSRLTDIHTSVGSLHVSSSGRFAAVVDYDRSRSVKIHSLDGSLPAADGAASCCPAEPPADEPPPKPCFKYFGARAGFTTTPGAKNGPQNGTGDNGQTQIKGRFLGHVIPTSQISISSRDKHRLSHVVVSDAHACLAVASSTDSRSWLVVADLASCAVIFQTELRGHVTALQLWRPVERVVYATTADRLLVYELLPTIRLVGETNIEASQRARCITFTKTGRHGFMSGHRPDLILALILDVTQSTTSGRVDRLTTINLRPTGACGVSSSADQPEMDVIESLELSGSEEYLLIRYRSMLVIFHLAQDRILKTIGRPSDVPSEFRLPRSTGYTPVVFTQAHFSADDCYVIGAIFRDIHVWPIAGYNSAFYGGGFASSNASSLPVATLRATAGLVRELYVLPPGGSTASAGVGWAAGPGSPEHGESRIASVACSPTSSPSPRVEVWNITEAVTSQAGAAPLDRLTSPVRDIIVTSDDRRAFLSAANSDELGVVDMATGRVVDLLTHEAPVAAFSVTPTGEHVFVALQSARPGLANKIWNTGCRKILYEFGDVPAYSVALTDGTCGFFAVGQSTSSVTTPYYVTQLRVQDNDSIDELKMNFDVPYVMACPFLTPGDRYLIVFSALDYDQPSAHYVDPRISAVSLRTRTVTVTSYGPRELVERVPTARRILSVAPCPTNSYNVAVLFTNESDRVGPGKDGAGTGLRTVGGRYEGPAALEGEAGGYKHNFGFLVLDVCSGVICQVIEDCFPPSTVFSQLTCNSNLQLFVDQDSNLFDMANGHCIATGLIPSRTARHHKLAANGCVLVATDADRFIYAVRIADGKLIGRLCVHGDVTCLELCHDGRTVLLGLADGSVLAFLIIDVYSGDDAGMWLARLTNRSAGSSTPGLKSTSCGEPAIGPRCWDKVNAAAPDYSRPPSALVPLGPTDKYVLGNGRLSDLGGRGGSMIHRSLMVGGGRRTSSTQLYGMSNRSQTCLLM